MEQKHTPLPYNVRYKVDKKTGKLYYAVQSSIDGYDLATIRSRKSLPSGVTKANANFISRACNSHYELLAYVKHLVDVTECNISGATSAKERASHLLELEELTNTITKAEGTQP